MVNLVWISHYICLSISNLPFSFLFRCLSLFSISLPSASIRFLPLSQYLSCLLLRNVNPQTVLSVTQPVCLSAMQTMCGFYYATCRLFYSPQTPLPIKMRHCSIEAGRFMCGQHLSDLDISELLKHFSWITWSFNAIAILISSVHMSSDVTQTDQFPVVATLVIL